MTPGTLSALLQEIADAPDMSVNGWEASLKPGATVGRFELVREIGRGGFGVVWEARDKELGRLVAFKAVRAGGTAGLREERLLREAEAAARLSHPNIVTLHDVGRSPQGPFLVLELLRGRSLADLLDGPALTVREAVRIAIEVTKGIAHAHAQGVVHRDIKPGNIFLCDDGQVKVLDLGLAHAFGQVRLDGGTPGFMAPEQWRGAPEDERTDVFALGVLLFRMLTGELPFPDDGGKSVRGDGLPAAVDVPAFPAIGDLVERMLAKDPVARPRAAGDVLEELARIQREVERAEPADTGPVRVHRRSGPARWPLLAGVGLALLAVIAGVGLLVARMGRPARPPPGQSIAVLPFADLSPNQDQEYFADGVAEEILNALAHVDGLRVAGRTSSFYFKGKKVKLKDVGRELNVAAVLEGSVRREGMQVRIKAQVVDVADGLLRWSETFDREATGVFAVQDEIAQAVVEALQVRMRPGRSPLPPARRTTTPEAYGKVLLGRQFHNRGTLEGFRLAAQSHERAIAIDPGYAPAWSGLAIGLAMLWNSAGNEALAGAPDVRRRALAAAEKAVALDPELADGWAVRATLRAMTWDWAGAEADIRRAQEIDPGDVRGLRTMGWLLASHGRLEEAVAVEQKADQLDPLNPWGWWNLARFALGLGRNDLAEEALKRSAEIAPDERAGGRPVELVAALLRGAPAEALTLAQGQAQGQGEEPSRLWGEALAEHALGRAREADAALKSLEVRYGSLLAYPIAQVHAWRGQKDQAFAWLERSFERHDVSLEGIAFDPLLGKLHGDPRYAALLRRMNLPVK